MPGDPQILSATTHELRVQFEQPTNSQVCKHSKWSDCKDNKRYSKFTDKSPLLWVAAM